VDTLLQVPVHGTINVIDQQWIEATFSRAGTFLASFGRLHVTGD
jgi:hypothetical protein